MVYYLGVGPRRQPPPPTNLAFSLESKQQSKKRTGKPLRPDLNQPQPLPWSLSRVPAEQFSAHCTLLTCLGSENPPNLALPAFSLLLLSGWASAEYPTSLSSPQPDTPSSFPQRLLAGLVL